MRLAALVIAAVTGSTLSYNAHQPMLRPELFAPGIISTGEFDTHPAFSPDATEFYFVRSKPDFSDWKIYVSRFETGGWTTPTMAPFSGKFRDADPYITPDGKRFYFFTDRAADGSVKGDMDIWVMEREGNRWGAPHPVPGEINSSADEWYPHESANGSLYFGSSRPGGIGQTDLYRANKTRGGFDTPRNLGAPVNSAEDEYEPWIAPDESYLIFMAARTGGLGGADLWISFAKDGGWTAPKNLGPTINGPAQEISPYVTPDGLTFYFASMRKKGEWPAGQRPSRAGNGLGDIFRMDMSALMALAK
jgi:Tol biopolymer transport system component